MAESLKEAGDLPTLPTREELLGVLGQEAMNGHVPAIRLMLEELRRDADPDEGKTPLGVVDELAARRAS
jgi:hypothetical protein